ncbi:MAG: DedA family protein [Gemmobacter sp.]
MSPAGGEFLSEYGPQALGLWVALGCAAVPVPVWPLLLLAGALASAGQVEAGPLALAALAGAMAGDGAGYLLGRSGGGLRARLAARPRIAPVLAAAEARLEANAAAAVFLTRWLVAPLGPYVNIAAGMAGLALWRVVPPALAGRGLWIGGYLVLGWVFADALEAAQATVGAIIRWVLAVGAAGTGLWLLRARWRMRQRKAAVSAASQDRKAASGAEASRVSGQTSQ